MITSEATQSLKFPSRREEVKGVWKPIYLEPMIGSGERICVGIVAANEGSHCVVPIAGMERFECMYGRKGYNFIQKIVDITISSLEEVLDHENSFASFAEQDRWHEYWEPPVQGIATGSPHVGFGNSLEEVAEIGLMMCASLTAKVLGDSKQTNKTMTRTRLEEGVRYTAVLKKPFLAPYFKRKRQLGPNVRPIPFGFVGNELAANFAVLHPNTLSANVDYVKARMIDLNNLRTNNQINDKLFSEKRAHYRMYIHSIALNDPSYTDRPKQEIRAALGQISIMARDLRVGVFSDSSVETMATNLVEAEAA